MSDTPRTDAVTNKSVEEDDGAYMAEDLLFHSRELERENAELRKDKERLDWLQSSGLTLHSWEEGDVWCESGMYTIRECIDREMEEGELK